MKFVKINGLIVAPFTPFDKKGEVDLGPTSDYAAMLQKNGLIGNYWKSLNILKNSLMGLKNQYCERCSH